MTDPAHPAHPAARPYGLPELALTGITCIWGVTFLIVHNAVAESGPLAFVGARFAIAALIAATLCWRQLAGLTRAELVAGMTVGASICGGYALQTWGLMTIPSSTSAFITAFYVPLVPLLQWLFLRHRPHPMAWLAVLVALTGLLLLAGPDGYRGSFGRGELLTALGALAIAVEIILISKVAPALNIARVTIVQLATASLLALLCMPLAGETLPAPSTTFIASAVALGSASALIQYVMNWAQKRISATRATLIYAGEPVWAGIVGALAGDRLPAIALLGAALIVSASLLSEWRPKRRSAAAA